MGGEDQLKEENPVRPLRAFLRDAKVAAESTFALPITDKSPGEEMLIVEDGEEAAYFGVAEPITLSAEEAARVNLSKVPDAVANIADHWFFKVVIARPSAHRLVHAALRSHAGNGMPVQRVHGSDRARQPRRDPPAGVQNTTG